MWTERTRVAGSRWTSVGRGRGVMGAAAAMALVAGHTAAMLLMPVRRVIGGAIG